jgi:type IV pilus modification protein PilV
MKRTAGFSLIEVLTAILLLGIGIVGLTTGLTTALQSSKESELQSVAALIAAAQIELLRAEGYLYEGEEDGDGGPDLTLYHWKRSVTSTAIDGLFEVVVLVEHGRTGQPIYELRTLLFDPPILLTRDTSTEPDRDRSTRREQEGRRP